jgi:hypothetical protein
MNGRGVAAFLAGLGTGYFNSQNQKKDRERQEKKDKMEQDRFDLEMKRENREQAQSEALNTGMQKAAGMKVGELRDETGKVDLSEEAFRKRIEEQGIAPEIAASTAPIYAKAAKEKGSQEWLSNSFDTPAAEGIGTLKETTKGDIKRKQAEALTAGGKYDQAINLQDQAEKFDIEDLQTKILAAKDFDEIDKLYDIVPDGFKVRSEISKDDGRLRYWYEGEDGTKIPPAKNLPQDFADFNEFKTFASAYVKQNPEYITASWDKAQARKKSDKQEGQTDKKFAVDMEAAALGIEGAKSDLKVKKATEGARIEGAGLDNKVKRANIANVYDEIAKRKLTTDKALTEQQYKANEESRKNVDQYRQDFNAAVATFDKSFKRDRMGNLMGDALNSQTYSQATKIIGQEIKRGATIDDAQAIGRLVYDEAITNKVSVESAYEAIKGQLEAGENPKGKAGGGKGAKAVDSFFP